MRNLLLCCKEKGTENDVIVDREAPMSRREEEELAKTLYHDTRQSLTPSMMMPYPPATTAFTIQAASFQLENDPQSMLQSHGKKTSVRETIKVQRRLEKPAQHAQQQNGYPGCLTKEELEACLEFRKQLEEKRNQESNYYEMVHCYSGVEEEAFALCRFMRARNFVVNDAFTMMDGNLETWKEGKAHDFYPNLEEALGCPLSVMWTQFPYLYHGVSKSGAIVSYFLPGRIAMEGIECLTDVEKVQALVWNDLMMVLKQAVYHARGDCQTVHVRCENVCVIDLDGLSRSLLNERIISIVKNCCRGLGCFPELLSKMVIVNAPIFFSASWRVIKSFLDPRTVEKIAIYSSRAKGNKFVLDLIDKEKVLSDYGGSGPSFDQVLESQRKDAACRQTVERFFLAPQQGKHECRFTLSTRETATVVVHTRSSSGASFSIKGVGKVAESFVKSEDGRPRSVEFANQVDGPGSFSVTAKSDSSSSEYFLVVIRVFEKS